MTERYWITGAQIGILQAGDWKIKDKILNEISENQFIGNMEEPYEDYEIIIQRKISRDYNHLPESRPIVPKKITLYGLNGENKMFPLLQFVIGIRKGEKFVWDSAPPFMPIKALIGAFIIEDPEEEKK